MTLRPSPAEFETAGIGVRPGDIYLLRDELIVFPEVRSGQERQIHTRRPVLVLSNAQICGDSREPVLTVCPLSHLKNVKNVRSACDLVLPRDTTNNLKSDSRLIFGHIQPILKADLGARIGTLCSEEFDRTRAQLIWMFGLDEEEN